MTRPHPRRLTANPPRRLSLERLEDRTLPDAGAARPVLTLSWQGQHAAAFANEWIVHFDDVSGSLNTQFALAQARLAGLGGFQAVQYLGSDGLFLVRGPHNGSFQDGADR